MTSPERWHRIQRVVDGALDLAPPARAAYLDEACRGDDELRSEAARLLEACERAARSAGLFGAPASAFAAGLQVNLSERYAVERELGRGGMATVYLARDVRHDRKVAVKVLEQHVAHAGAERFMREIRIAARLTHPHVLGVHDSGESDGRLYYVMPYVEGETLRSRLTREGALPLADAVRLLRELADGVAYAHQHGVMHRDLKPENVLLSGGHAVVADFGIAKALAAVTDDGSTAAGSATGTGVVVGTPAYMAPEQVAGDPAMDHRADLYALGVIGYEILSGVHPFAGRSPQAVAAAHLTETPSPVTERRPDIPPALAALIMQLLAKDPAARPQRADDVLRALDRPGAVPDTAARRRRTVSLVAGAAVLAAAGVGAFVWRASTTDRASAPVAIRTLAVLPFVNTSGSPDDDYFSDGLTDELAHALRRIPGLQLSGRSSSYAFKGRAVPAHQIGRALDVGALVDGTVRRAGDRLRVTAQLVSTADGKVLWDSVYESRSTDVFAVQDELTRAIVAAVAPTLLESRGASARVVDVRRGTADEAAYELYLKGRYHWVQRGAENLARSVEYYNEAIARDPKFARAHAGLSLAYSVLPNYVPDLADSLPALAMASAQRAVALDSTTADAQIALALALDLQLQFRDALARYRVAAALDPANATVHHLLGVSLLNLTRTDEAIVELRRGVQADPLALSPAAAFAAALLYARRYPESDSAARRLLSLDSTFAYGVSVLGLAQAFGGQPDSAVRTMERGTRLHPEDARLRGALLFAYAAAGRWADAERVRAQLRRPDADRFDGIQAAFAELVFGDREPLVRVLTTEQGLERYTKHGGLLGCNPLFDPLWSDARFLAAMRARGVEPCGLARAWPLPSLPR